MVPGQRSARAARQVTVGVVGVATLLAGIYQKGCVRPNMQRGYTTERCISVIYPLYCFIELSSLVLTLKIILLLPKVQDNIDTKANINMPLVKMKISVKDNRVNQKLNLEFQ